MIIGLWNCKWKEDVKKLNSIDRYLVCLCSLYGHISVLYAMSDDMIFSTLQFIQVVLFVTFVWKVNLERIIFRLFRYLYAFCCFDLCLFFYIFSVLWRSLLTYSCLFHGKWLSTNSNITYTCCSVYRKKMSLDNSKVTEIWKIKQKLEKKSKTTSNAMWINRRLFDMHHNQIDQGYSIRNNTKSTTKTPSIHALVILWQM